MRLLIACVCKPRLAELGIRYLYRKDLAPTQAVRDRQAAADKATKTAKRKRTALGRRLLQHTTPNVSLDLIHTVYWMTLKRAHRLSPSFALKKILKHVTARWWRINWQKN